MTLKQWLQKASKNQKAILASYADTSVGNLLQMAYGHRTPSAEMGAKIVSGVRRMIGKGYAVPAIKRSELVPACAKCEHAKKCGG